MYFKLAAKNVKKSFKDYAIYFITLTVAVCVFYVFNSISSQDAILKINSSSSGIKDLLNNVISVLSVFVSFILGLLILYANNFILKRRKKELGLYMVLGMDKSGMSVILFFETFIIGLISLAVGLLVGIFASQGLSILTANLLAVKMDEFKFVFSKSAMIKTLLYFGIIYLMVIIFNSFVISKYKVIDLLYADKKNQNLKIKNITLSAVLFILCVACLGVAYKMIIENGLMTFDKKFAGSIVLGVIGTFLFFMSLSGFMLKVVQKNKKTYLKDLNMFVFRQINSKINTNYISMSLICLMLFVSVGMLSTAFNLASSMNSYINKNTPFDVTFYANGKEDGSACDIEENIKKYNINIYDYTDSYVKYKVYNSGIRIMDYMSSSSKNDMGNLPLAVMPASEFNKVMDTIGEKSYTVDDGKFLLVSMGDNDITDTIIADMKKGTPMSINGKSYEPESDTIIEASLSTGVDPGMIVVVNSEDDIKNLPVYMEYLSFNYNGDKEEMEKSFVDKCDSLKDEYGDRSEVSAVTRDLLKETYGGLKMLIIYVGLYIGIIFIITSVAVLALQQLSEAADNVERFNMLKKIGVDQSMINKAVFSQTFIYFMMPLSLAVVHSIVGLKVANNVVKMFGMKDVWSQSLKIAGILILIYGVYFLITYNRCKAMVKDN